MQNSKTAGVPCVQKCVRCCCMWRYTAGNCLHHSIAMGPRVQKQAATPQLRRTVWCSAVWFCFGCLVTSTATVSLALQLLHVTVITMSSPGVTRDGPGMSKSHAVVSFCGVLDELLFSCSAIADRAVSGYCCSCWSDCVGLIFLDRRSTACTDQSTMSTCRPQQSILRSSGISSCTLPRQCLARAPTIATLRTRRAGRAARGDCAFFDTFYRAARHPQRRQAGYLGSTVHAQQYCSMLALAPAQIQALLMPTLTYPQQQASWATNRQVIGACSCELHTILCTRTNQCL